MNSFARITGLGAFFPQKKIPNQHFEEYLDTTNEWIVKRTGIKNRYFIESETVCEMAHQSALQAIANANIDPCEIQLILVATVTPDKIFPSTASTLQSMLQIPNCFSMDINAACSGFLYALDIAEKYIQSGLSNILIVGVDALSRYLDMQDRKTCILFGDGAGAAVVSKSAAPGIIDTHLQNMINQTEILKIDAVNPADPSQLIPEPKMKMEGQAVFKLAVTELSKLTKKILQDNNLSVEDIDCFIPHQANIRIIQAVSKNLNIPSHKIIETLSEKGNTSSASIPTTLHFATQQKKIQKNDLLLLLSFGAGITMGAVLIKY